ncbi:MAG: hypothetical protein QOI41_3963, partial [Myxococcales bacterium]|nr:hypothetical protein [Myxococcales bacterium]
MFLQITRAMPHNGAMRRSLAIFVLGAILAASHPAWADTAEATKAFEEGRKLRDQRDFEKAAAAFERSIAAERSIGAFYNLGFSYEQLGRTRDALDAYRSSAAIAKEKSDPREKEANEAVGKLLDTHNYVTLVVSDDLATAAGVRIVVDGEPVPPRQAKGEIFRSASQHEILVSAPGHKDLRLQASNKQPVNVILGEPLTATVTPPPPPPVPPPEEPTGGGWGWQKWTGSGMIAGGVVSLVVTAALFFPYLSERLSLDSEAGRLCPGNKCPRGEATNDLVARNNANIQDADDKRVPMIVTGVLGGLLIG